jgi:hypothetical protein
MEYLVKSHSSNNNNNTTLESLQVQTYTTWHRWLARPQTCDVRAAFWGGRLRRGSASAGMHAGGVPRRRCRFGECGRPRVPFSFQWDSSIFSRWIDASGLDLGIYGFLLSTAPGVPSPHLRERLTLGEQEARRLSGTLNTWQWRVSRGRGRWRHFRLRGVAWVLCGVWRIATPSREGRLTSRFIVQQPGRLRQTSMKIDFMNYVL